MEELGRRIVGRHTCRRPQRPRHPRALALGQGQRRAQDRRRRARVGVLPLAHQPLDLCPSGRPREVGRGAKRGVLGEGDGVVRPGAVHRRAGQDDEVVDPGAAGSVEKPSGGVHLLGSPHVVGRLGPVFEGEVDDLADSVEQWLEVVVSKVGVGERDLGEQVGGRPAIESDDAVHVRIGAEQVRDSGSEGARNAGDRNRGHPPYHALVSDEGPLGDPFGGLPIFGDLARLLRNQGPLNWDAARQFAVSIAGGGASEPNVDPLERMRLEELARVAELQVAGTTGLSTSIAGRALTVMPVTRTVWAQRTLDAYRPLFDRLATALSQDPEPDDDPAATSADQLLGGMMKMLAPMMLGMAAGSMVGHLSQRSFGQYDLPVPRAPSDELLLVKPTIDGFVEEWSLVGDDLRLWVCLHEISHHAVLGVPHVRTRLESLLGDYVAGFQPDPDALEHRLADLELDPTRPDALESLQQVFGDPEAILGAMQSPAQRELLPRLEALVAVVASYVDYVMDEVGGRLIGSYGMVTEAVRRHRVEAAASDRFVAKLFGLELTQAVYDRGERFVSGVVERAGADALARLWASERELPTPAEVDAPGLWLARIELPED